MINIIISLAIMLVSGLIACGALFVFKGMNIKREYRFKQHSHIAFFGISIVVASVLYFALWILTLVNDYFADIFKIIYANHLFPSLVMAIFVIYKSIYKIYFNSYIKNHLEEVEDHLPNQYYEKDGKYYIAPSFTTASSALKLALIIVTALLCIGNGVIYYIKKEEISTIIASFETFLILPLFIHEIYSYFDGIKEETAKKERVSEDVPEARTTTWASLDKEYFRLWHDHLLGRFNITNAFKQKIIDNTEKGDIVSNRIAHTASSTKSNDFLYSRVLSPIMRGENIIVESCLLQGFSDIIVPIINIMFSASKRIMFVCDNQTTVKQCSSWLEDLDIKSDSANSNIVIDVLNYEKNNTVKSDGNVDIYIGTVDMALNSKVIYENIDVLICINIDKTISENALSLNLLASVISSDRYDKVQYVLFGNRVNGLRPTASQIFMVNDFEYQVVNPSIENDLSANFWMSEKGWMQSQIVSGFASQFIGQLIPLAIPPFKFDIPHVDVISKEQSFSDQMVALQTAQPLLKKYMQSDILNITEAIAFNETENFVNIGDKSVVVVGDTSNNAALVLLNWLKYAKQDMFLNIVSAPYLLRDYIVANMDFFIGNVECIGNILPIPKSNIKLSVYRLINQLCYGDVAEEALLREIKNHETDVKVNMEEIDQVRFITESLQDLTKKAFNTSIYFPAYLKSEKVNSEKIMETKRYYKLLGAIKNELPEKLFKDLSFVDSEQAEKILKKVPVFELYQNYLEGQYVSFEGKLYLIDRIDYDNGIIDLTYSSNNSNIKYRQCRTISNVVHGGVNKEFPTLKVRNSIMKKKIISADLVVNTEGYYEFNDAISLVSGGFRYKNVDTEKKGLRRTYKSTNVLSINISSDTISAMPEKDKFKLSFTLSVLLNELFETLFADIKQYIITRSVVKSTDSYIDFKGEELIRLYQPIVDENAEDGITIYFTEDTELEKGITDTIVNNFDNIIMRVLFDYLFWLLKEKDSAKSEWCATGNGDYINIESLDKYNFIKYGYDSIPEALDLTLAFDCLLNLILKGEDTLTYIRGNYINKRIADDPFKKFEEAIEKAKKEAEEIAAKEKEKSDVKQKELQAKQDKKTEKKSKKKRREKTKADNVTNNQSNSIEEPHESNAENKIAANFEASTDGVSNE